MKRVLIAEDNPDTVAMLRVACQGAPFDATFAEDGKQAIKFVEESPFDFYLLDITMPFFNGYVVAEKIFALYPVATVVLCTAYNLSDISPRAKASGVAEVWFKPFAMERFVKRITCAMGDRRDQE